MRKRETTIVHGPWTTVRTVADPGEETPTTLYDALNGYIPDAGQGSGVSIRPPIVTVHNPRNGEVGQAIHQHTRTDGTNEQYLVRGGRLERWNGSLTAPTFTNVTPGNMLIPAGATVDLTSFGGKLIVNAGFMPWVFDPATGTGTLIQYGVPTVVLSRGVPDTTVAIASTAMQSPTVSPGTLVSSAGVTLGATTITTAKWGVYRVYATSATSFVATPASGAMAYNTEALAIAAVPAVPAGSWDLGYFTVQASGGFNFVAGTSALQGGASGVPAQTTNYYAPAYLNWSALASYVYSAQLIFILVYAGSALARSTITWSEINDPLTGYRQTNYDNAWSLTQTSEDVITALAPTNNALYFFRPHSIGQITGNISRSWRTEATLDDVSTSHGTEVLESVALAEGYIWFQNADGLPHRFQIGSRTIEPVWLDFRDTIAAAPAGPMPFGTSYLDCGQTAYLPDLRLVVMAVWGDPLTITASSAGVATSLYVFSAVTGHYQGRWAVGMMGVDRIGTLRDDKGRVSLCVLGPSDASTRTYMTNSRGAMFVQRHPADIVAPVLWSDDGVTAVQCSITTGEMLGDAGTTKRYDRLRARLRCGEARTFDVSLTTPWQASIQRVTPTLSSGVGEDRVLQCGLAIPSRWVRVTIAGPIDTGGILAEDGTGILTESGLRLSAVTADTPLSGPIVFESVEVEAHPLGRDRIGR